MTGGESTIGSTVRPDLRLGQPERGRVATRRERAGSLSRRELAALGALLGLVVTGTVIAVASASTGDSFGLPR